LPCLSKFGEVPPWEQAPNKGSSILM
jgi:hypothetical protein